MAVADYRVDWKTALFLAMVIICGCKDVFYWEPECKPSQYKLGAFTEDGHPTIIMNAFSDWSDSYSRVPVDAAPAQATSSMTVTFAERRRGQVPLLYMQESPAICQAYLSFKFEFTR